MRFGGLGGGTVFCTPKVLMTTRSNGSASRIVERTLKVAMYAPSGRPTVVGTVLGGVPLPEAEKKVVAPLVIATSQLSAGRPS